MCINSPACLASPVHGPHTLLSPDEALEVLCLWEEVVGVREDGVCCGPTDEVLSASAALRLSHCSNPLILQIKFTLACH